MADKDFNTQDNFKKRYAAMYKLQKIIMKFRRLKNVKFTSREDASLGRMINSLQHWMDRLESDYYMLYKEADYIDLREYIKKDDNGNKNK